MQAQVGVKRPRVIGLVGIALLRGLFTLYQTAGSLDVVNNARNVPGWVAPLLYLSIGLAVLSIIAAVLIALYRRWGLYLAVVAFGVDLALLVILFVAGQVVFNVGLALNVAVTLLVLYYVYKYLTQEPEKSFFT